MGNSRLPVVNKLLYTADLVGTQAMAQSRHLWLLFFLAPPVDEGAASAVPAVSVGPLDIDPRVFIGIVLTAGRVIEAIDDPIVGWWSDRTRSRWGRRIPFILFGTPFYAFFFALLWLTPWGDSSYLNAIYLFVVLELFFLATTLTGGPYEALLPEIAPGHRDRMSIVAWQFYFGIAGAVAGLVLSGLIKDQLGFFAMGAIFALMALASRYAGLGGVWRHAPRETPAADIELGAAFTATLRNKQFLYFLPTFVFYQLAVSMVISWLPFFVTAVLERENEGAVTSMLTAVALSAMVLSAFALWKLGDRKGKRWVYSACLLGTAVYMPFLFFAGFLPSRAEAGSGHRIRLPGRHTDGGRQPAAQGHHRGHHRLRPHPHGDAARGGVLRDPEPVRENRLVVLSPGAGHRAEVGGHYGEPAGPADGRPGGRRGRLSRILAVPGLQAAQHGYAGDGQGSGPVETNRNSKGDRPLEPERIRDWLQGPMIPMVTPFTEDFRLDLDALRHNLRFTIEHGVTTGNGSLLVGGAAGEHPLLSVDERKAVMEAAVDAVQGDAPVITSIQHTDARTVADMARHAARVGISAVQVSPAYYYPATEGDVLRLFHRVAAAADVSIMAYNTWWLGFSMSLDLIEQLAEIETVRALKWATPDDDSFRDGIVTFADRLVVLDNTDNLAWSHALGARGFVGHLGTCWPEYPLKTWSLLEARDYVGVKDHMASFKWAWRRWIAKRRRGDRRRGADTQGADGDRRPASRAAQTARDEAARASDDRAARAYGRRRRTHGRIQTPALHRSEEVDWPHALDHESTIPGVGRALLPRASPDVGVLAARRLLPGPRLLRFAARRERPLRVRARGPADGAPRRPAGS